MTAAAIIEAVAEHYHIRPEALSAKGRYHVTVRARHMAMYLVRDMTRLSLKQIGKAFGGRDHSTVIHAVGKVTTLIDTDERVYFAAREIKNRLAFTVDATGPRLDTTQPDSVPET